MPLRGLARWARHEEAAKTVPVFAGHARLEAVPPPTAEDHLLPDVVPDSRVSAQ